jgi:hypothetical protein
MTSHIGADAGHTRGMTLDDALMIESALDALLADGHSRTRATELVIERTVASASGAAKVVLVEGLSDQIALEVVARRRGRVLDDEGIAVVPMGGATNIRKFLAHFRAARLAGLYDVAQERHFARNLERAGLDTTAGLASIGFFACERDLEDELIRAVGITRIEQVIDAAGEAASFRRLQHEPFHRGRAPDRQVHRFISSHSGRKYRYARLLAEALEVSRIPRPLSELLAYL